MVKVTAKFTNNTKQVLNSIANFVDVATETSLAVIERNVKVNTPVKHGTLKRSISRRMTGFGSGEVYTDTNYAIFMEFGTRYIAPRAMFRKGVQQSESRIINIFKKEAQKVDGGV